MNIIKIIILLISLIIFVYIVCKIIVSTVLILNKNKMELKNIIEIEQNNIKNEKYKKIQQIKNNKLNKFKIMNILFPKNLIKKKKIKKNICLNHEKCLKNNKKNCKYNLTNYIHPYHLSEFDKKIFMLQRQPNFTLQDYVNWLLCYKHTKYKLNYMDYKNLDKILNNNSDISIPILNKNNDIKNHYDFNNIFAH